MNTKEWKLGDLAWFQNNTENEPQAGIIDNLDRFNQNITFATVWVEDYDAPFNIDTNKLYASKEEIPTIHHKVIVVVEQDAEDVTSYALNTGDNPAEKLKELWQKDLNYEIKESTRTVDTNKSFCEDDYAEIWYTTGTTPIKYFVTDVKNESISPNNTIEEKKAIMMSLDDFSELIETLTDGLKSVDYEFTAYITHSEKAYDNDTFNNEDITTILSKHFNKNVTSWHSEDNKENPQIWIIYQ